MTIETSYETSVSGVPEVRITDDSLTLCWDDSTEVTVSGADGRRIANALAYVLLEAAGRHG